MGLFNWGKAGTKKTIRNEKYWKKVENTYKNCYQSNSRIFLQELSRNKLIEYSDTSGMKVNINDEKYMQRISIFMLEFDRFFSYVFQTWFLDKLQDLNAEEEEKIKIISNSMFKEITHEGDALSYVEEIAEATLQRWDDYKNIDIENNEYGIYDGKGNKVKIIERPNSNSELVAMYEAMSWMMTDVIYTTLKKSKSLSYMEVVEYLKDNHLSTGDMTEEEVLMSMRLVSLFGVCTEIYVDIAQTVNWMTSKEFR